jgi:hypothetical protein
VTGPVQTADATVQAVQTQAAPLGLNWALRVGTVLLGTDPAAVILRLDGGDLVKVNGFSMVGPLIPGMRVYVMEVPPAGQYVVGFVAGNLGWGRGIVKWASRDTASSTTTAADAGVLQLDGVPLEAGRMYRIWTSDLHLDSSVANDEIRTRIRYSLTGTATTADAVLPGASGHVRQVDQNVSEDRTLQTMYVPASNQTMSLLLCVGRIAGTGNVRISNTDADNLIVMAVEDVGPAQAQSGVAL